METGLDLILYKVFFNVIIKWKKSTYWAKSNELGNEGGRGFATWLRE